VKSKNSAGWESEDYKKLLFFDEPNEKQMKIKKIVQDDWQTSPYQVKINKDKEQYRKDDFKIESEAEAFNFNFNDIGLPTYCADLDIEKRPKLMRPGHNYLDLSIGFDSTLFSPDRISSSNPTLINYVSDGVMSTSPESKFSCANNNTLQSACSNVPTLPSTTNIISKTSITPVSEDSKLPSEFYTLDYPLSGRDNESEAFSFSPNSQTSEFRSITDPSTWGKESLSTSVRSLPLMENVDGSKPGVRRSSFDTPKRFAFPSSVREQKSPLKLEHINKLPRKPMKKSNPEKLRRSQKTYKFLTTGTPLLKYCRRNSPHWRHFEIDTDLECLVWYSDTKPIKQTRIRLADIEDVIFGQVSPRFQKNPRSRLFHQSFSIKYKGKNYLDLICVTHRDCQMWYHGLKNVIKNIRDGDKWLRLKKIDIPNKPEKSKNAIYPAGEGETWIKYVNHLHRAQDQIQELFKRSEELLESSSVLTMRKMLKKRIKQLDA